MSDVIAVSGRFGGESSASSAGVVTAWSAPGRPSSPPSGAEARVKRQKHLQTNGSGNTLANRDRRLTRGARFRYSDRRSGTRIEDLHNFQRRGAEPKTASLRGIRGRADPGLTPKATGAPVRGVSSLFGGDGPDPVHRSTSCENRWSGVGCRVLPRCLAERARRASAARHRGRSDRPGVVAPPFAGEGGGAFIASAEFGRCSL